MNYISLLNPLIAFSLNVITQVLSFRYRNCPSLLKSLLTGFLYGSAALFIFDLYLFYIALPVDLGDGAGLMAANMLIYGALSYCYFNFVNLGETARRIRIMRELFGFGEEGAPLEDLLERYNAETMVSLRMARLLGNGQVIDKEGCYFLGNRKLLFVARVVRLMKWVVMGKESEFAQRRRPALWKRSGAAREKA